MSKHALIIDADYLAFSSMAAAEVEFDWGDGVWTLQCDHEKAFGIFQNSLQSIIERRKEWKKSKIIMAFTDAVNWRKDVLPTYKEGRKKVRKPLGYNEFVVRLKAETDWEAICWPTLEGDDVMGIIATNPSIVGCKSATMVSCDKDFKTIPAEFYWLTTGEIINSTEETANYYHMYQTIMGDLTDGYTGIRGVGAVIAEEFLSAPYYFKQVEKTFKSGPRKGLSEWSAVKVTNESEETTLSLWDQMVSLADKQGMTEDELIVQAQVARILRAEDYDVSTHTMKLWTPLH